jgi:hypothetical protein
LPQVIGKINWPVKGGKDHIFLRLGLLRSPYSAQKNVAYARTLSGILLKVGFLNARHPEFVEKGYSDEKRMLVKAV